MDRGSEPLTARRLAALARRLGARYTLRDLPLAVAGAERPYSVALPADPDAPLDSFAAVLGEAAERDGIALDGQEDSALLSASASAAEQARRSVASGVHMPYWGLLWPSGQALAEVLLAEGEALRRARTLELGCGLGFTATVALERGARLTAVDCFAEALLLTRYNALRNVGREPRTLLVDWRSELGRAACVEAGPFEALLAADVLYEAEDVAPLLELAPRLLAPGGTFWLAEPGRRVARLFVEAARARGWGDEERVFERAWPPDGDVVRVSVHRFTQIN